MFPLRYERRCKMGNKCIYDVYSECFNGCEDCIRYKNSCDECYESEELYDFGDEILCIDCLLATRREDFYNDFIDNNSDIFIDFIKDVCYPYKI